MASGFAIADAFVRIRPEVDDGAFDKARTGLEKKTGSTMDRVGKRMGSVGSTMTKTVTAPIIGMGAAMFSSASNLQDASGAVEATYGKMGKEVLAAGEDVDKSMGMSKAAYFDNMAVLGSMTKAMGFNTEEAKNLSSETVGLSSDLASFYGTSQEEAFNALRGALAGEFEGMKKFGVVINQAQVEAKALEMGLWDGEGAIDAHAKAAAANALIMERTSDVQGDYKRTADGATNTMKTFKAQLSDVSGEFGQNLLPLGTKVLGFLSGLLESFNSLSPSTQKFITVVLGIAAAIGPILIGVSKMITAFTAIKTAMMGFSGLGALFPWGAIILALIAVVVLIIKYWDEIKAFLIAVWNFIKELAAKVWGGIKDYFVGLWQQVVAVWQAVWNALTSFVTGLWEAIKTAAKVIFDAIKAYFTFVLGLYKKMFLAVWNAIKTAVEKVWEAIKTAAKFVFDAIKAYFEFVLGIYKKVFTVVWNAIKTVLTTVWDAIKAVAMTVFNALKAFFERVLRGWKRIFTTIWNAIKGVLTGIWDGIKAAAMAVFNALKAFFERVLNGWKRIFTTIWNAISGFLSRVWDGIKATAVAVFNAIKRVISNVFNGVKGAIMGVWRGITGWLKRVWNGIKSTASNVFNKVREAVVGAFRSVKSKVLGIWGSLVGGIKGKINAIIGFINGLIRAWNSISFTLPSKTFSAFGKSVTFGGGTISTPNLPTIPRLAQGGNLLSGGEVLVGERGREKVSLPPGARVTPLSHGQASAGPTEVRVFIGDRELTDIVRTETRDEQGRWQRNIRRTARQGVTTGGF